MHHINHTGLIKYLFIILLTLVTTGCAHKELIDAAENFNRQGRYEQAVEQYQQALELKPDDNKTRQKLSDAQAQLDIWLDDVLSRAEAAKQDGLDGKALILFSKVAQLRRDQNALKQYKQLHQQLGNQSRYKVAIQSPKTLGDNVGRTLTDVQVINRANKTRSNEFTVKISHAKPSFNTYTEDLEKVKQYVSGVTAAPNPDYLHLQDDIVGEREHIHKLLSQLEHLQHDADNSHRQVDLLQKDLEIARLRWQQAPAGSAEQRRLQQEVAHYQQDLNQAQYDYEHEVEALDTVSHKLRKSEDNLTEHLNALSYLPPTVNQDVLSDYMYSVEEVTRSASAKVTISFNDEPSKSKTVAAEYTDEGHEEHPRIKLDFNPVKLISDKQLTRKYYDEARKEAEKAIADHADRYRSNLRNTANQLPGANQQMEGWVSYGVSSEKGVDGSTARRMQNQLYQELGYAGQFPINTLLHLFKH